MFKIGLSDGLAILGVVLALVLVVLDKAGKLRGSMLLVLLAVAAILTLPLMLNFAWVGEAQGVAKFSRGLLMFFVVGLIYSLIAVWVSPTPERITPQATPISEPKPQAQAAPSPRYLDEEQRRFFAKTLGVHPKGNLEVKLDPDDDEAFDFARQLAELLQTAGWTVNWPFIYEKENKGLLIGMPDSSRPSPANRALIYALAQINFPPRLVRWPSSEGRTLLIIGSNRG